MYTDAVVEIFAPALRIWTGHGDLLKGYVSGQQYAVAIEIIQGFLTTIHVVGLNQVVLYTEQANYPFDGLVNMAETLRGIPIFSLRHELQPEYRTKVLIESAKIILSVDWTDTPESSHHLH
ncbi:hypothetical protein D3C73_174180 [compost metagenome]